MNEAGQKKWKPTTLSGPLRGVGDLGDRQAGRVGREDRVARRHGVEVGEHACLIAILSGTASIDEVDVAEPVVAPSRR